MKGGGCSGLSYTFSWEKVARLGDAAHGHRRVERFDQFHPELLGNPESSTPS